jgi:hypothetical protein
MKSRRFIPLDVFHDHKVTILLPALVDHLNDIGVVKLHAGFGFLVKPVNRIRNLREALAQNFDRQRDLGRRVLAAIDPREGAFCQVEEDLGIAEKETARVALFEPIDLPARKRTLSEQHSHHAIG